MPLITGYSYRAKGYVKTALLKLGYVSIEKHGSKVFYHCRECEKTFPKASILIHYSTLPRHKEICSTLVQLLTIWGLIEREENIINSAENGITDTVENPIELTN